ncbi:MAG: hypothetical protein AAGI52_14245 [Bacteroidota bacterium]
MRATRSLRQRIGRRPRLWGLVFALLLLVSYVLVIRPVREVVAQYVAYPIFAAVETPRSAQFDVVQPARRAEAVFVLPAGAETDDGRVVWAAPAGVIFLLPAMFLLAAFPTRPYWIYLLGYHAVLGIGTIVLFALGIGWIPAAFDVHQFARTYVSEGVSLTVPLLLFLAGKADEIRREDAEAEVATSA